MDIKTAGRQELLALKSELESTLDALRARGLSLDMSRGKPGADQLNLSEGMLTVLAHNEDLLDGKTDTRNYGVLEGIMSCRKLFGELLHVPSENVLAGGNSSLTMMYDTMLRLHAFGAAGVDKPFSTQKVKWLCPVPGYDRHFAITEQMGYEMISIPTDANGPDMGLVEKLVNEDSSVKGIWCVPQYSNPAGTTYSDDTVRRMANLKPAARDFRIFWDNAYCVHDLQSPPDRVLSIFDECKKAGSEDSVFIFASTSKITYPGAGVAVAIMSDANMAWTKKLISAQAISPDKVNQLRHVRFFKDVGGIMIHMEKHAAILAPKFKMVADMLEQKLGGTGAGSWDVPRGGYFVSYNSYPSCAKRIIELCKSAGVVMTAAGATHPYGRDPLDSNLRIAPSFPPVSELKDAMEVFCTCALLAAAEKRLEEIA